MSKLLWTHAGDNKEGKLNSPTYKGDAGFDMVVSEDTDVTPGGITMVPCGIKVALPRGVSALVMTRSSTAKNGMLVFTTLIDQGYRGPLFVMALNFTKKTISVSKGDRIAQLLPVLTLASQGLVAEFVDDIPESDRGSKGFGSSGK